MRAYERFITYAEYPTMSDATKDCCPSTKGQLVLANLLKDELIELGLTDARVDKNGYVYAHLEKNCDGDVNDIGFIAHMDTSSDAPDKNIKPKIHEYNGGDIILSEKDNIILSPKEYPSLESYIGQHLITSDGKTLIGADDKAGIAEIMTALEKLINSDIKHGKISVAFTPDEEIGRGADLFDVAHFGADYAYTVDGGAIGEIEYENFNAASAKVTVQGISIHPGSAKNKMKNASKIAFEFNRMLPRYETPEHTEGYEGFYHLTDMSGHIEFAELNYIIRDHDMNSFTDRKECFERCARAINEEYGEGTLTVDIKDSYYNMKEKILPCMHIIDRAKAAMEQSGIKPIVIPIRGGTDGARLSFMGLPCPNLSTGGENFHSRFEFVSVEAMEKMSDIILKIIENVAKEPKM